VKKKNPEPVSPFSIKNVRLFIYFRVFFNARFYYPVFTILFLDFGLTIEQFALLNVAWAAAIVLLEVPSGALADTWGRKNLLVAAGALMMVEIALLCFVPRGNPNVLFIIFLVNRILSGAAEAAASGADEALAYDSLQQEGDVADWGIVLERQMRVQAAGYIIAMSLGAAVYDPDLVQRFIDWIGIGARVSQNMTLRFPVLLTLVMAVMTLLTTLQMKEITTESDSQATAAAGGSMHEVFGAFKLTLQAGTWILKTPIALVIILIGLVFDSCLRMAVTLTSQYYRLIQLPEASFGLIGSAIAVVGLFVPRLARAMVNSRSPEFNLVILAVLSISGLVGMTLFLPLVGVIPIVLIASAMYMLRFFQSHYLNRITSSAQRATVLSFKGLSMNLAYGLVGISYSFLVGYLRTNVNDLGAVAHKLTPEAIENTVFVKAMGWFPWYFSLTVAAVLAYGAWQRHKHKDNRNRMSI
jgi:MFS family permease